MPDNGTEKCVCCGCDTGVPFDMPVSERKYYIQGSGQLCSKGYMESYTHRSEDETTVSLDEMNELIRLSRE